MTQAYSRPSSAPQPTRFEGLPWWSALAIIVAALITGMLLSVRAEAIGLAYLLCFAVFSVGVTLFVEARGLFLTVVSIPIFFSLFTVITAWWVGQTMAREGSNPFSTTSLLVSAYPLAQFFPWVLWITVICLLIAIIRVLLLRRAARIAEEKAQRSRRLLVEQDRAHTQRAASARRHSAQITVQELLERDRNPNKHKDPGRA